MQPTPPSFFSPPAKKDSFSIVQFLSETFPTTLLPYSQSFFLRIYDPSGPYFQALRQLGFKIPNAPKIIQPQGSTLYWQLSTETFFFLKYFSPELVSEMPTTPFLLFSPKKRLSIPQSWTKHKAYKKLSQHTAHSDAPLTRWLSFSNKAIPSSVPNLLQEIRENETFCFSEFLPVFFLLCWKRLQLWQKIQILSAYVFPPERAYSFRQSLVQKTAETRFATLLKHYPQPNNKHVLCPKKWHHGSLQPLELSTARWSHQILEAENSWTPPTPLLWDSFEKELPFIIHGGPILQQVHTFFALSSRYNSFYELFGQILHRLHLLLTRLQEKTDQEIFYGTSTEIQQEQQNQMIISERKKRWTEALNYSYPTFLHHASVNKLPFSTNPYGLVPGQVSGELFIAREPSLPLSQYRHKILWIQTLHLGWIPILLQVKGVLLAQSPLLSEASQLLQILHIPCISGVPLEQFPFVSGDVLQIDGTNATISKMS